MFDGIAYGKGGAVLGMVENYLGKEVFRQGVHNYLAAHLYANATAEDFWNAQTANSHLPVDKIMSSFVTQPGVPLLTLSERREQRSGRAEPLLSLSRRQETATALDHSRLPEDHGQADLPGAYAGRFELPIPADAGLPFLYANAGGKGYYRTAYTPAQYSAIVAKAETALTPPEKIGLLGDRWALVRSGQGSVGDYLDLVLALKQDPNAAVLDTAQRQLEKINADIATDEDRAEFAAVLRRQFGPVYKALGSPVKDESFDRQQLRGTLFEILGAAHDPAVLAEAKQLTRRVYPASGKKDKTLDCDAVGRRGAGELRKR